MGKRDPRVDSYIEKAAEFARPILRHLRETIHAASPEIDEEMKWSVPHFTYKGILCSMAAFKQHCAFGFWKQALILRDGDLPRMEAMGLFGRIRSVSDLPSRDVLIGYVREAMRLNEEGVKAPASPKRKRELETPKAFRDALERRPAAQAAFAGFSPSHRYEYVEWIAEAKRQETRDRRIATATEWIAEGKPRNWKYMKRS